MRNSLLAIIAIQLVVVSQSSSQSAKEERNLDALIRNYDNVTNIDHILNLFSVGVIGSQWRELHKKLSSPCTHDMMEYLSGLEQKEIWAIKSKLLVYHQLLLLLRVKTDKSFSFGSAIRRNLSKQKKKTKTVTH